MMTDILKIKEVIKNSQKVTIISHYSPDGDALASQLALARGLEQIEIEISLINKDPIPDAYQFLKNWECIKPLEEIPDFASVIICVDCATWERTGYLKEQLIGEKTIVINIDHHISNTNFGHLNWVDPNAAATAELIYDLLGLLQVKIDKIIATSIYTGISTDTGSFLYENTTATTHIVVADLINRGADINLVRNSYYENINISKINLLKYGLNNLSFSVDNQVCWVAFTRDVFNNANATDADGEGLINHLKSISGVEVAIIFRETTSDTIKLSFRSKKWADVNQLASKYGGGGHPRAAGCTITGNLDSVVDGVINWVVQSIAQGGTSKFGWDNKCT